MICPINRLFKIFIFISIISCQMYAGDRDDLYKEGLKAFKEKAYIEALKKLYAYYILNEKAIITNKDFYQKLNKLILKSEDELKNSIKITNNLIQAIQIHDVIRFNATGKINNHNFDALKTGKYKDQYIMFGIAETHNDIEVNNLIQLKKSQTAIR